MPNMFLMDKMVFDVNQMSQADVWKNGIMVTIIGFCLVMMVLLFIAFVLVIFGWVTKTAEKKAAEMKAAEMKKAAEMQNAAAVSAPAPVQVPAPQPVQTAPAAPSTDDLELVAAITAAIAAGTNTSPDRLVVRSMRLRHAKRTAWKNDTLTEQHSQ